MLVLAGSPDTQHDARHGDQAVVGAQDARPQPVPALTVVLVLIAPGSVVNSPKL